MSMVLLRAGTSNTSYQAENDKILWNNKYCYRWFVVQKLIKTEYRLRETVTENGGAIFSDMHNSYIPLVRPRPLNKDKKLLNEAFLLNFQKK